MANILQFRNHNYLVQYNVISKFEMLAFVNKSILVSFTDILFVWKAHSMQASTFIIANLDVA